MERPSSTSGISFARFDPTVDNKVLLSLAISDSSDICSPLYSKLLGS